MKPVEQQFFNDLEKKLWTAADRLRSNLDAAVYKHVVLGLIFLKWFFRDFSGWVGGLNPACHSRTGYGCGSSRICESLAQPI